MRIRASQILFLATIVVSVLSGTGAADVTVFTDQSAFESAALANGSLFLGMEDFENNTVPAETTTSFPDGSVLEFGTPLLDDNGFGFPNGLQTGLVTVGATGNQRQALVFFSENVSFALENGEILETPSDVVGPLDFADSVFIEVHVASNAVGFDLLGTDPFGVNDGDFQIDVFDEEGVSLLSTTVTGLGSFAYLGFVTEPGENIGRITVNDLNGATLGGELIDNVQVWSPIPEPSSTIYLFAALAVVGIRRARRFSDRE